MCIMTKAEFIKLVRERFNVSSQLKSDKENPIHVVFVTSQHCPTNETLEFHLVHGVCRFMYGESDEVAAYEYDNWQDCFRHANDELRRAGLAAERRQHHPTTG